MGSKLAFRHSSRDRLSVGQRSANMRAIRAFGTGPERTVYEWIQKLGHKPEQHVHSLPGRPDFVFRKLRRIVFVYGDFWHGWRFPAWEHRLSEAYWRPKIRRNRDRDRRNRRRLRAQAWSILIIWEHQLRRDPAAVVASLRRFLD